MGLFSGYGKEEVKDKKTFTIYGIDVDDKASLHKEGDVYMWNDYAE